MADDPAIDDLLLRWEDLRAQGLAATAEDLCGDRPELVGEVRRRISILEAMYRMPGGFGPDDETCTGGGAPASATAGVPRVDGYEVVGVLGRGGMGVVYRARQLGLGRLVALKMITAGRHASPRDLARFRAEAEAVARLQHANIVAIHDVGEAEGSPYYTMELAEAGSLEGRLDGEPQPAEEAARLVATLARAIHFAHSRGIVHRDLKPANVLLAGDGTPKIGDFGLAKRLAGDGDGTAATMTQSGAILGTPAYMAPEQAAGLTREVGPAADIYALGVILYEMLTGRCPFRGTTPLETLEQVRGMDPVPPRSLRPRLARDLETICLKCLEKDPARRYANAEGLADDLGRHLQGEPIAAKGSNVLDRLARALDSTRSGREFTSWGNVLLALAPIMAAPHVAIFIARRMTGRPPLGHSPILPGISLMFFTAFLIWRYHRRARTPMSPAVRQLGALLIGHLLACIAAFLVCEVLLLRSPGLEPGVGYAFVALLGGQMFFSMGATYWGRLYLMGLLLLALSWVMALHPTWAPLVFAVFAGLLPAVIGLHLRRLGGEAAADAVGVPIGAGEAGPTDDRPTARAGPERPPGRRWP